MLAKHRGDLMGEIHLAPANGCEGRETQENNTQAFHMEWCRKVVDARMTIVPIRNKIPRAFQMGKWCKSSRFCSKFRIVAS
jgi:hypothetical protein